MRCRSVLTRVDAHRTGELERDESKRLEEHLETCPSCNESVSDVDALASVVRSLAVAPPRSCLTVVKQACCDSYGEISASGRHAWVGFSSDGIRMIDLSSGDLESFRERYAKRYCREVGEGVLTDRQRTAIENALAGEKTRLPDIDFAGFTEFERLVLESIKDIPRGEVRSYEWVAGHIGRPKSARAVGNALAANPVPLLLPCHRVVPAAGGVGRYAFGSEMKRSLLESEGVPVGEVEEIGRRGVRFIGSATTKIFCVPTCRDARRIREQNEVPFRSAREASEKGFRPCKTCRPVAEVA